jgi:predicted PurR-regulated permease PerM
MKGRQCARLCVLKWKTGQGGPHNGGKTLHSGHAAGILRHIKKRPDMEQVQPDQPPRKIRSREVFDIVMQLLVVALLISYSFRILEPFFTPLIWASILAVTLYPLHQRMTRALKGRKNLAASLIVVLGLLVLILPMVWLGSGTVTEVQALATAYRNGQLKLPPPPIYVKDWPMVGDQLYGLWSGASASLQDFIMAYPDQAKVVATQALSALASTGKAILLLSVSIILAGILLSYAEPLRVFSSRFFNRLTGNATRDLPVVAAVTVRKVVKGVLGVALVQSALATVGMMVAHVPWAGIWGLLCLLLAIMQIGMLPVSVGVIIYIWQTGSTTAAILLTVWMLLVGMLDNILKPLLLGKGAPAPMMVVFLGSIGGFLLSGFVGLFTGAVILSLGWIIFDNWLSETSL